ncbi:MAG TPA: Kdo hydroxylase family protein [Acidobacteriaceae bacterium]|nr:Kdo hydroxylase family protein [Acidobacteriaceae bacterium]
MSLVTITATEAGSPEQHREWCEQLEAGSILFFPKSPIALTDSDLQFLRGQQQSDSSLHKNIAYKPKAGELSGVDTKTANPAAVDRLRGIMRNYSQSVTAFLTGFLSPYDGRWQLDYASFRPQEEEGRDLPLRRRNDLLHTDAFPTRPTHGARILRFFNNIHPTRTRDWIVSDPFRTVATRYAPAEIALPQPDTGIGRAFKSLATGIGLGAAAPALKRSPYDDFMMRFHNFLKENRDFQSSCPKYDYQFPPGSSWMVYTDMVPHAVLCGQYALEQTFLVSPEAMVAPRHAPLAVLEELAGARLL